MEQTDQSSSHEPASSPSGMKYLNPKAAWLFFINYLITITIMMLPFIFIFVPFVGIQHPAVHFILGSWLIIVLILLSLGVLWSQLSYKYYKYELRDDGFRKEHGVIWKKYVTIPYERIQNVDIYRGLFARILGLSDLNIQTAGMSVGTGSYGGGSEGRLPGLSPDIAEQLRDDLIRRARSKSQGL